MEELGVIRKVTEPTDWVNSLTYVHKPNGKLRICLDPQDLNKAIQRVHHAVHTVDDVKHKFQGSHVFSKLDAKNGYWAQPLDEESALLTTFNSPCGRYCFTRLLFGLVMSQDVFQRQMDQITEGIQGCVSIADDVVIHGRDQQEHDTNLRKFLQAACNKGLKLNKDKCMIAKDEVPFFGEIYSVHGTKPDPPKTTSLEQLTPPRNKTEVQHFLGLANYLTAYIPHLVELTKPLRDAIKKDMIFEWTNSLEEEIGRAHV